MQSHRFAMLHKGQEGHELPLVWDQRVHENSDLVSED